MLLDDSSRCGCIGHGWSFQCSKTPGIPQDLDFVFFVKKFLFSTNSLAKLLSDSLLLNTLLSDSSISQSNSKL